MLPSRAELDALPAFTPDRPLRMIVSACLARRPCGVDGTSNGDYPWVPALMALPNVSAISFCPEEFSFGVPRDTPDLHGGDGFDVLDGKARVLTQHGVDWTDGMIRAAHVMLGQALAHQAEVAILMDMSAACGSQVISLGGRFAPDRKYQRGAGVASALLQRHGVRVIAQRDFRTLEYLHHKLDATYVVDETRIDHHETEWVRTYFGAGAKE